MDYELYDDGYDDDNIVEYINDYYDDVYFDDDYLPQQLSGLLVLWAVAGTAALLILVLSWVKISIPSTGGASVQLVSSTGLGGGEIAPLFTPEVRYWSSSIAQWSQQTGIDANLIATVMQIESCGDPFAKSGAGAIGLFQVMPYHFESGEDPYKPDTNALRGLNYLQRALAERDGIVRLGFAGYNGGITGAKRPESQWANETQRYVYWGTGIYEDAIKGKENSERLDEWLAHGGASLCQQATNRLGINP